MYGLQMVGAERELRLMIQGWEKDKLKEFCADRGIKWQFTTPLAPHHNGCAQSMVKSVKTALKCAIGDTKLTPFELYTVLLEAANLVNQRPICRIPHDPDDGAYLCSNDILMGRATNDVPQGPFRNTKNPRHRFEFCQKLVDAFWKRWVRDVFSQLVPRKKWTTENRNVQVDDVVIVAEPNAIRGKWNIGRVQDTFPGDDGKVRKCESEDAHRSVHKTNHEDLRTTSSRRTRREEWGNPIAGVNVSLSSGNRRDSVGAYRKNNNMCSEKPTILIEERDC